MNAIAAPTLSDPSRFLFLYGTTPPRADASEVRVRIASSRLAERAQELPLDGLVVYDVQDESDRTIEPRPFPFLPTKESRSYSQRLYQATGLPVMCYKSVAAIPEEEWEPWLDETRDKYGLHCLSLVGRASSHQVTRGMPLAQAIRMASSHHCGFTIGGVVIPERHRPGAGKSESVRLLQKAEHGCRYFISQAVYSAESTIELLGDYQRECREQSTPACRIFLTFTPCGNPKTLQFMKWLGIHFPEATERALLSSTTPLQDSIEICTENLERILDEVDPAVPLGVNVESVSIRREEILGSIDLFHALYATVDSRRR